MTIDTIVKKLGKVCKKPFTIQQVLDEFGATYMANGVYRSVYAITGNEFWVIKAEHQKGKFDKEPNFRNVQEYMNYCNFIDTPYQKWLAPIRTVTYDSRIAIQRRVEPVTKSEMPKKIPPFFTDTKVDNWGWLGGRIVCVDYPYVLPDQSKMKIAKWK